MALLERLTVGSGAAGGAQSAPTISGVVHFLLVYDRAAGRLLVQKEFATDAEALTVRFVAEAEYGVVQENVEILAISAASEQQLKKSHGRYFLSSQELGERLVAAGR